MTSAEFQDAPEFEQSRHRERAKLLGYELSVTDEGSIAHWIPAPMMSNSMGRVHGGLVGSIVDDVAAMALRSADPAILMSPTISMHIDYLRPLVLGAHYLCKGKVLRLGGRVGVADTLIIDDDGQLCVRGSGTFAITRRPAPGTGSTT
ncbi:MAG: hypothetical protein JWN96_1055 [Mycobacterium sp.]|nr:hypothetical protein [Mycobacterium sp.]